MISDSHLVTQWSPNVPQIALQHDNMQYMMFSVVAFRLLCSEPDNVELMNAQQVYLASYLALAIREQQTAFAHVDAACGGNAPDAQALVASGQRVPTLGI